MTDIALIPSADGTSFDLAIERGQIVLDPGLRTGVIVSLFADARASADDALPAPGADRRGWWGDAFGDDIDVGIGSKLWLLGRAKALAATVAAARDHAASALAWLRTDAIAATVAVDAERQTTRAPLSGGGTERLAIGVTITRPDGPARERYDFVWEATL